MYNEKLSQLADFLAHEVKDVGFYMGEWVSKFDQHNCATVACAFGWAPTCFGPESGLSLDPDGDVVYDESWGIPAAMKFFGITDDQAHYLFVPEDPQESTPRLVVARRIKQFAIDGRMHNDPA